MEKIAAGSYLEHGRLHHLTVQERYYAHRGTRILTELWLCQPVLGVLKTLFLCPVFVSGDFWVIFWAGDVASWDTVRRVVCTAAAGGLHHRWSEEHRVLDAHPDPCWIASHWGSSKIHAAARCLRVCRTESSREFSNQILEPALLKKKVKIEKSFAGREISLSLTFQRAWAKRQLNVLTSH